MQLTLLAKNHFIIAGLKPGWPTEGPGELWVRWTSAFWHHQALISALQVGELQPRWFCLSEPAAHA